MLEVMKLTDPEVTLETRILSINELDFLCMVCDLEEKLKKTIDVELMDLDITVGEFLEKIK